VPGNTPSGVGPLNLGTEYKRWKHWRRLVYGLPILTRRYRVVKWAKWAAAQPGAATSYLFGGVPGIGTGTHTDCSGFVLAVYRKVGLALPRTSQQQYAAAKRHPARDAIRPGDLVCFNYEGPHSHIGICVGPGVMIADQHTGSGIVRTPIDWAHFDGAAAYLG
jgi:cell wall-associated NlpC family hydrolase